MATSMRALTCVTVVFAASCGAPWPAPLAPEERAARLARLGAMDGTYVAGLPCNCESSERRTTVQTGERTITLAWHTTVGGDAPIPGPCPVVFAIDLARDVWVDPVTHVANVASEIAVVDPACTLSGQRCNVGGWLTWNSDANALDGTVSFACGGQVESAPIAGEHVRP